MTQIPIVEQPLHRRALAVAATLRRCRTDHGACDCSSARRAVRGVAAGDRLRLVRFAWRTGMRGGLSVWCQELRREGGFVAVYSR